MILRAKRFTELLAEAKAMYPRWPRAAHVIHARFVLGLEDEDDLDRFSSGHAADGNPVKPVLTLRQAWSIMAAQMAKEKRSKDAPTSEYHDLVLLDEETDAAQQVTVDWDLKEHLDRITR